MNTASIFHEGHLYVFGGTSLTEDGKVRVHNDLWILHLESKKWECLHPGSDEFTGGESSVAFSQRIYEYRSGISHHVGIL